MRIGLIQLEVKKDKHENNLRAESFIKKLALENIDIAVLPEMFNCPYDISNFEQYSEDVNGPTIARFKALARDLDIYIVVGSIPEKDNGKIYNTSFVINRQGKVIAKHRKTHLFDVDVKDGITFKESKVLSPGNSDTVFETEFGTIGLAICYDMRFPEFIRAMTLKGATVVIVPAAFNMTTGPAHWHTIAKSRALDNQVYFALCSPARSTDGPYTAYGHSLVANPWGSIDDELSAEEDYLIVDIDFAKVEEVRKSLPLLQHRRKDIY